MTCELHAPDAERLAQMRKECVSEWMTKMSQPQACVEHFSGVGSESCSAADLRTACERVSCLFTIRDAEHLCDNLQAAHQTFWPEFWRNSVNGLDKNK